MKCRIITKILGSLSKSKNLKEDWILLKFEFDLFNVKVFNMIITMLVKFSILSVKGWWLNKFLSRSFLLQKPQSQSQVDPK